MNSPRLDRKLLRDVSRSFYLSLRILPGRMRPPCALGYLLARLSDTIADTVSLSSSTRLQLLRDFRKSLRGSLPYRQLHESLCNSLQPHVSHPGERRLVDATEACFQQFSALDPRLAHAVSEVVQTITTGQESDLRNFAARASGTLHSLRTSDQLLTYADQVAGSVGRFWTTVGFLCYPRFSKLLPHDLSELGTRFGQALQLVNILRDLPEDLDRGRCYLPLEELDQNGWRHSLPWRTQTGILQIVSAGWEKRAEAGLREGLEYANSLRLRRIKIATALPSVLGLQTIALLRQEPQQRFIRKVKITRSALRQALVKTLLTTIIGRPIPAPGTEQTPAAAAPRTPSPSR